MRVPVLVTGGAGYVGSHACRALAIAGHYPIAFDNLSTGDASAVRWGPLEIGDITDKELLVGAMRRHDIAAVLHFAGLHGSRRSVAAPHEFFRNNVRGSISVLEAMAETGVRHIVFSSSGATYGRAHGIPIGKTHPQVPVTPYGVSKLAVERALREAEIADGITYAALRYFTAAGADPAGEIGDLRRPRSSLVPRVLAAAQGLSPPISIFGNNWPTFDGTCVRDYIHVSDLADAHVQAMIHLLDGKPSLNLNLGIGGGYSVAEIIDTVERITGRRIARLAAPSRDGNSSTLVMDSAQARSTLGWHPVRSDLDIIVYTAWAWARDHRFAKGTTKYYQPLRQHEIA